MSAMAPNDLTIRTARTGDDAPLAALDRAAWSTLSDVSPRPPAVRDLFDERHTPDQYLVAELAGGIVGYVRNVPATPLEANRHVRQIQGLAVAREARGRGVGRALVEAVCEAVRAAGARRITLRVLGHNTPARRLYEACGFRVEGVLPEEFLLDGTYVDDVLMGRSLTT
ncbi:GNAT family N-acetyltransferase [Kitasatospora sp. NBC_01539]|uniref:GNAT family N-acetyltransferase n=1 Tax=Kitasatospora sp. NBC_01539 TaxID=2903577 RepID=UPI003860294D